MVPSIIAAEQPFVGKNKTETLGILTENFMIGGRQLYGRVIERLYGLLVADIATHAARTAAEAGWERAIRCTHQTFFHAQSLSEPCGIFL